MGLFAAAPGAFLRGIPGVPAPSPGCSGSKMHLWTFGILGIIKSGICCIYLRYLLPSPRFMVICPFRRGHVLERQDKECKILSDLNRNNPKGNPMDENGMQPQGRNPWQRPDRPAPYDDPQAVAPADGGLDYSAWRRPSPPKAPSLFAEEPAPYGAEMLQGGVPLYAASQAMDAGDDFARQGQDAPTRVGRPALSSQMVSKRKTVERATAPPLPALPHGEGPPKEDSFPVEPRAPGASPFAAPRQQPLEAMQSPEGPRSRRAGRVARHQGMEGGIPSDAAPPAFPQTREPLPAFHPSPNAFDSFHEEESGLQEEEAPKAPRRPAVPGERYTGARTAMPASGAPVLRSQVGALPREQESSGSLGDKARQARDRAMGESPRSGQRPPQEGRGQRPPMGPRPQGPQDGPARQSIPRPQGAPGQRPPQAPGPRPQRPPEDMRRREPQGEDRRRPLPGYEGEGAALARRQAAPVRPLPQFEEDSQRYGTPRREENGRGKPAASVRRPRYDFEDEEDVAPRRRRGCLVPVVILLLALGVALAGVWLPDWNAGGGPVGTTLGGIKASLSDLGDTVIGVFSPGGPHHQLHRVPAEGSAPASLVFSVQTSTRVGFALVDEQGMCCWKDGDGPGPAAAHRDPKQQNLIWSVPYTMEEA